MHMGTSRPTGRGETSPRVTGLGEYLNERKGYRLWENCFLVAWRFVTGNTGIV